MLAHTNSPLWDNGSIDSVVGETCTSELQAHVHLRPPHQHVFESGVTQGSSLPLLDFMSGWAEKTEWDMRQLISTLTLGWTALTSSCLLLLTDLIMYKQRLKWKCPRSKKKKNVNHQRICDCKPLIIHYLKLSFSLWKGHKRSIWFWWIARLVLLHLFSSFPVKMRSNQSRF